MMTNNLQNMIIEGNFGNTMPNNNYGYTTTPLQESQYNPYYNNITAYQQYYNNYQPQQYYNGYQQPMPTNIVPIGQENYNNNGYVFRPAPQPQYYNNGYVGGGLGCNQQQYYQNQYYNNPYYNRYASRMSMGGYDSYSVGFNPDGSMRRLSYREAEQQQIDSFKIMIKCCDGFFGRTRTEEELEEIANPKMPTDTRTQEEIQNDREFAEMQRLSMLQNMPQPESRMQRKARLIGDMSYNMHQAFDNMSLCEFLNDHFWKLREEQWLRENVDMNAGRNLRNTYSSDTYNELLGMHKSSNPYTSQILDSSRYESSMNDLELGLPGIVEAQRRKKALLEGKVPTFISSEETQQRRSDFINKIIGNMYKKHGGGPGSYV